MNLVFYLIGRFIANVTAAHRPGRVSIIQGAAHALSQHSGIQNKNTSCLCLLTEQCYK